MVCDKVAENWIELELKDFISGSSNAQDAYETLKIVEEIYRKNKL